MLKLFISYSHKDDEYRKTLEKTLSILKREKILLTWSDRKLLPGDDWINKISEEIKTCDIFIPLLSQDFIASDYCYDVEMKMALSLHDKGSLLIVPIVIRPCAWKNSTFSNFQLLPSAGLPVTKWENIDDAWVNVYDGLYNLSNALLTKKDLKPKSELVFEQDGRIKVGIFGETASGKSTLCNALIGHEKMLVSDLTPITREPERAIVTIENKVYEFIDCPGIGESVEDDLRIEKIYLDLFKEVDFIIWVIRADIRNYSPDQKYISLIKQLQDGQKKFCIVLNMIDRIIFETQGWDNENNKPNKSLEILIERKKMYVSGLFQIIPNKIIETVGFKKYNIESLKKIVYSQTKTDANMV